MRWYGASPQFPVYVNVELMSVLARKKRKISVGIKWTSLSESEASNSNISEKEKIIILVNNSIDLLVCELEHCLLSAWV